MVVVSSEPYSSVASFPRLLFRKPVKGNVIKLSSAATREFWAIPVLFEDDHMLALNKPPCLLTSPDRYDPERPNLMKLLHHDIERGAAWARDRNISYLSNA